MEIILTKHVEQESRKRLGIPKRALGPLAEKAYLYGKVHADFSGKMKRYLDKVYLSHEKLNNIRIYGEFMYGFRDNVLITLWRLKEKP